ncbi:MAG: SIMPL domain-containing protein [Dehalococcoidales bacterium]|nr:SIMPL domain-containing protein [Dehalococcoidales bacterium]
MIKKLVFVSIVCLMVLTVSACAAPNATPGTTVPGTTPGAASPPVGAPDVGAPGAAPAVPTQGAAVGVTTPVAPSAAPAMAVPGVGFISPSPIYNQYQSSAGIMVTGQGQIKATPDIAYLSLGVSAQALTVAQAQSDASNAMNAVMEVLKSKGIADADITTTGFNIYPVYDYTKNTNTITGYQVSNMITVTIRKIADASAIIDAAAVAGGNFIRINSISFSVSDPTPYLKQARAEAMADAKAKGAELATLGGVTIGLPTFITESSGYFPPTPLYYGAVAEARDAATPISPGQTEISVSVTVIYAIQ